MTPGPPGNSEYVPLKPGLSGEVSVRVAAVARYWFPPMEFAVSAPESTLPKGSEYVRAKVVAARTLAAAMHAIAQSVRTTVFRDGFFIRDCIVL